MRALIDAVLSIVSPLLSCKPFAESACMVIWMVCKRIHAWHVLKVFVLVEIEGGRCAQPFLGIRFVRA